MPPTKSEEIHLLCPSPTMAINGQSDIDFDKESQDLQLMSSDEINTSLTKSITITSVGASPNPFDAHKGRTTAISYTLSKVDMVSITINQKNGGEWKTFNGINGMTGLNQMTWDGKSDSGQNPTPGQSDFTVTIKATIGTETTQASFDVWG